MSNGKGNTGISDRHKLFTKTGEHELTAFIDIDPCTTNKLIPDGVAMNLKLFLNKPAFFLLHGSTIPDKTYTYKIKKCTLYVQYVEPHSEVYSAFHKALCKHPYAIYPYIKTGIKTEIITPGVNSASIDNIITHTPDEIIICMTSNAGYVGSFTENPFNFETFGVNFISVTFEAQELNGYFIHPNFTTPGSLHSKFSDAYMSQFLDAGRKSEGNYITPVRFSGGYFILKYSLPDTLKYGHIKQPNSPGITRLQIGFATVTTKPITILIYTRAKSYFGINARRCVHLDIDRQ